MTTVTDDPRIVVTELPDVPTDSAFGSVLDAYAAEGFDQGYAHASRDLLAIYPLLIEQFLRNRGDLTPSVRAGIRDFSAYLQNFIGKRLTDAGFVEDGLGI